LASGEYACACAREQRSRRSALHGLAACAHLHHDAARRTERGQLAALQERVHLDLVHRRRRDGAARQLLQVRHAKVADTDVGHETLCQARLQAAPRLGAQRRVTRRVQQHQVDVAQLL
jgi:hypothetical protein